MGSKGTSDDSKKKETLYPQIYLIFNHIGKATEDIWALTVDTQNRSWMKNCFQMPCNPDRVIDKCVANLPLYRGLFVLYREESDHPLQLRFVGLNPTKENPTVTSISQPVPKMANHLASFENKDGYTDLLISGDALTWRSAQQCFDRTQNRPHVLSEDTKLLNLVQMSIAQSKDVLSVWALNTEFSLSYQEFTLEAGAPPSQRTPAIPLLEKTSGSGRFAALQSPTLGQKLFVIDEAGGMKMLEQSVQTGIWQQPTGILVPDSDEMIEFTSHTIRVHLDDQSGIPMTDQPLKVCSSTSAEMLVNGSSVRGSPDGQVVQTDDAGSLTIIIRSDGLSAPLLTLRDVEAPGTVFQGGSTTIDPMSKLWLTVGDIKSAQDLKDMQLPDGTSFVRPGVDEKELEMAAKALQNLSQVKAELASSGTAVGTTATTASVADRLWGMWYWIRDKVQAGYNWVVEKVEAGWQFVVKLAGEAWTFLLNNAPQVAEAMQKVLGTITKGWEWLKKKFAFIFNWGDILSVKNVFVNLTTQGILWGADSMAILELKSQEFFEDLRQKTRMIKAMKLPPDLAKMKAGNDPDMESKAKAKNEGAGHDDALKSPEAQYGVYHMKHGGTSIGPRTEGQTAMDRLVLRLKKVWDQLTSLIERCKDNFANLFKSKDITVETILTNLGLDLLEDLLGAVESIATGVLGSFSDLLVELADGINKPISIPVLSPLYKKITRGSNLTILDAVALCIAIPTTIVYKTITGKSPMEIAAIGPLAKAGAFKSELDERMGRAKAETSTQEPGPPLSHSTQFSAMMQTHIPELHPTTVTQGGAGAARSVALESALTDGIQRADVLRSKPLTIRKIDEPASIVVLDDASSEQLMETQPAPIVLAPSVQLNSLVSSATPSIRKSELKKTSTDGRLEQLERNRKRFEGSSNIASNLTKMAVPVGALLWFQYKTFPSLFLPEVRFHPITVMLEAGKKLLLWMLQFGGLAGYSFEDIKTGNLGVGDRFKDPWFEARFGMWVVGGIPIIGELGGKYLGYCFSMVSSVLQVILLAWLHIKSWTVGEGYSVYLAFEEWGKLNAKIATAFSGITQGGYGYGAIIAYLLQWSACTMNTIRATAEASGSTKVLYTGMDLG